MYKGIVMEKTDSRLIVMTPEGKFESIPSNGRNCQIGEEIVFSAPAKRLPKSILTMGSIAAAVVLAFALFTGLPAMTESKQVVAYVSIDINPSIELGIDKNEKVRELRGLNMDGLELVKGIDFSGKPVDQLTVELLQQAETKYLSKGEGDIVIASTLVKSDTVLSFSETQLSDKLKSNVAQHIQKTHPQQASQFEITAFAAPAEVRETAQSNGLSTGKYTVYLSAKNNGEETHLDDFKKESVHMIAKESGGISELIDPNLLSKDYIKELLDEEKDGRLDKKQREKQLEKKKEEDKRKSSGKNVFGPKLTPSPSNKPTPTPTKTPDQKKEDEKKVDEKKNDKNNSNEDKPKADDGKLKDNKKEEGKKAEDKKIEDKKIEDKKVEDKKVEDKKVEEKKIEESKKSPED